MQLISDGYGEGDANDPATATTTATGNDHGKGDGHGNGAGDGSADGNGDGRWRPVAERFVYEDFAFVGPDTSPFRFAIERMGAALEVTVTLEQRPPGREETIQRTLRSSILLRN